MLGFSLLFDFVRIMLAFTVYIFQVKESKADAHIIYVKYYIADSTEAKFVDAMQKEVNIFVACFYILTTLHYRRIRGDMIETYKIVTGKYETCVAPSLSKERTYVTKGNNLRLKKFRVKYDL